MSDKILHKTTKLSDVDVSKVLNLDLPLFKCSKKLGSPGLALAWCLINNKGLTSIASMHRYRDQKKIFVILETAFSDYPVANRGTFRTVATGYMKISDLVEFSELPSEIEKLKIKGVSDKIGTDDVEFSIEVYHNSSFCKAPDNSQKSGVYYFDIYKDENCQIKGWNIATDFMKTLYSFLQKDDDELFENNQLFEEDNAITIKYHRTFADEKNKLKLRYDGYVKPIIKYLYDNKIGIEDGTQNADTSTISNNHFLSSYHNIIISGPPGTGKSYLIKDDLIQNLIATNIDKLSEEAEELDEDLEHFKSLTPEEKYTRRITFSSSTSQEDFFGCYKPVPIKQDGKTSVTYSFVPGVFSQVLSDALKNPHNNYVLIIEELNRTDVYDVFGQVFQLLDRDETQSSTYGIAIPKDAEEFFIPIIGKHKELKIPPNMFIICTINSADQGVKILDTAFKRRFSMVSDNSFACR